MFYCKCHTFPRRGVQAMVARGWGTCPPFNRPKEGTFLRPKKLKEGKKGRKLA